MKAEKKIISTVDGEEITIVNSEHGLFMTNAKPDPRGSWVAEETEGGTRYYFEEAL